MKMSINLPLLLACSLIFCSAINAKPSENMVRIHFHRPDNIYQGWVLYPWGRSLNLNTPLDAPINTPLELHDSLTASGMDDFGIFFDVPIKENAVRFGYIIHKNGRKNVQKNMTYNVNKFDSEVWHLQGDSISYAQQPQITNRALNLVDDEPYHTFEDEKVGSIEPAPEINNLQQKKSRNKQKAIKGIELKNQQLELQAQELELQAQELELQKQQVEALAQAQFALSQKKQAEPKQSTETMSVLMLITLALLTLLMAYCLYFFYRKYKSATLDSDLTAKVSGPINKPDTTESEFDLALANYGRQPKAAKPANSTVKASGPINKPDTAESEFDLALANYGRQPKAAKSANSAAKASSPITKPTKQSNKPPIIKANN